MIFLEIVILLFIEIKSRYLIYIDYVIISSKKSIFIVFSI